MPHPFLVAAEFAWLAHGIKASGAGGRDCFGAELFGRTGVAPLGGGTGGNGSAMCHCYSRGRAGGT